MRLSVIIPALDEAAQIGEAVASARRGPADEVIVVDGGSTDATLEIAARRADRALRAAPGRATQMNAGAADATGDVLLFLHADTRLPDGYRAAIAAALSDAATIAGRFDVRLVPGTPLLALVGWLMNLRSRLTHIATGDQAIFVRRAVFDELGGFPAVPLMEDVGFTYALKRRGRIACLRLRVETSSRRWLRDGPVRTILLMWWLRFLYACGVAPERLQQRYANTR